MALGFTTINSSSPAEKPQAASNSADQNADTRMRSMIAQYLGRGEDVSEAPIPTGTKKTGAKGKKRAAPKSDTANTKCRRISSIKDGMQVTKATEKSNTSDASDEAAAPAKKQIKSKGKKSASKADTVSTDKGEEPAIMKPVSVYASTTSMDALDSTPARTSFDSAKANAGQSITLYEGSLPSTFVATNYSTPWLESSTGAYQQELTAGLSHVDQEPDVFQDPEPPRRSSRFRNGAQKASAKDVMPTFEQIHNEGEFSDIEEEDLMDFARSVERLHTPPPRKKSQNMREVDEHEDYGGDLLSTADKRILMDIERKKTDDDAVKPIVRKPFQPSIQDRSPIWGASNATLLRTCFRLGEAFNTGSVAARCNQNVVIELYARVTSWREEKPRRKQHFVFKDLYHDKPPLLEGVYELWDQALLWDLDSKAFLRATDEEGVMCRAIAKMKREQQKWRLEVLSIWECTWEDVNYVAGIFMDEVVKGEH